MTDALGDLLDESRRRGFLGPGDPAGHRHHAAAFGAALSSPPSRVLDLGAGGGLPGLVLAAEVWTEARWTFLDAQARRVEFLQEAVDRLAIADRVEVIGERAELVGREPDHRGGYDAVVARSFGSPGITAECAAPLLRVGGHLVVSEPPDVDVSTRWLEEPLGTLGFGPARRVEVSVGTEVHLAVLELVAPVPDRFPRRVGIPAKRPLF